MHIPGLGPQIVARAKAHGLGTRPFARIVGVTRKAVDAWRNGSTPQGIRLVLVQRILDGLDREKLRREHDRRAS